MLTLGCMLCVGNGGFVMTIKYGIMFSFLQGYIGAYGREKERDLLVMDI